MAEPYRIVIEHAELTGLSIRSAKHGKYLQARIEIPLTPELDVSGMSHTLFGAPAKLILESVQAILPVEALESPEAAG